MTIKTKYYRNRQGQSRVKAWVIIDGKTKTISLPKDYSLELEPMHRATAKALADKWKLGTLKLRDETYSGYEYICKKGI